MMNCDVKSPACIVYRFAIRNLTGHTAPIKSIKILENGDLASRSQDFGVKIWNVDLGTAKKNIYST